jgi:toxin-antitoxin system PIN domain toxin
LIVRIVTNHRIFREPSPLPLALEFCSAVLDAPPAVAVRSGDRHWHLFARLCRDGGATGNLIPDADLVALALEHGATLISTDRGMLRWPGLTVRHPLEG